MTTDRKIGLHPLPLPHSDPFPSLEGSPYGPNPQAMEFGDEGPPQHHRKRDAGNPGAQITKKFHPKEYEIALNDLKAIRQRMLDRNFRAWDSQQKMQGKEQPLLDFIDTFPLREQMVHLGDRSARFEDYSSPRVLDRLARSTGNYPVRGEAFREVFRTDPKGTFNPERYKKQVEVMTTPPFPSVHDAPELVAASPYLRVQESDDESGYYRATKYPGYPATWSEVQPIMGPPVPDDPPEASAEWREKMKNVGKPSGPFKDIPQSQKPRYTPLPSKAPRRPFPYRP